MKSNFSLKDWLFTPFKFIAGTKALIIGLIAMGVLSILGYLSNTYFDGALDIHYGIPSQSSPYSTHLLFQILNWISLTSVCYITARIISKSSIRLIDMAGTLAMSQIPLILAALIGFLPAAHISFGDIDTTSITEMMTVLNENIVALIFIVLITIIPIIWSIILKYNAYSISANVKGITKGVSFVIALIVSEIISKMLIHIIVPYL